MIRLLTERLVIRNFLASDAHALCALINQYEDSAYALYDHQWPTSLVEIVGITEWFARGDSYLAVGLRSTSQFIGFVALDPVSGAGAQVFNLGYIFDAGFHHHGYASEACQAVLDYAFGRLAARQVVSDTASVNRPSCLLLERLGFHKTAEALASLRSTAEGTPIEFLGSTYVLPCEKWSALHNK
jgi:[ribosomal protein S5]-alanine N-acetyltransferase